MSSRIFLAVIGAAYVLLAVWCIVKPTSTASAVGFELRPGSGESEYLTVYGGLQLGLGLFFLWPLFRHETALTVLLCCLLVHGAIVVFRTVGFIRYSGIGMTTLALAAVEWCILLGSVAFFVWGDVRSHSL
jgi:hypothetical protein